MDSEMPQADRDKEFEGEAFSQDLKGEGDILRVR